MGADDDRNEDSVDVIEYGREWMPDVCMYARVLVDRIERRFQYISNSRNLMF